MFQIQDSSLLESMKYEVMSVVYWSNTDRNLILPTIFSLDLQNQIVSKSVSKHAGRRADGLCPSMCVHYYTNVDLYRQ